MEIIYSDCDYLNDERDNESAPIDGDCTSCYRYNICKKSKEEGK